MQPLEIMAYAYVALQMIKIILEIAKIIRDW